MKARGTAVAALIGALLLASCGGSARAAGTPGRAIKALATPGLPPDVLGLKLQPEDASKTIVKAERSYVDALSLSSLRDDQLVQATLEIGHVTSDADPSSTRFRNALVGGIRGSTPQAFRIGDETVYVTQGLRQRIAVWFRGRYFFILSTREEYGRPRALLRKALRLKVA